MRIETYDKVSLRDILYLDADVEEGVKMLYDIDVIRMPINIQQVLETVWGTILKDQSGRMSPRNPECPWLQWVRQSQENYQELWNYGMDIMEEHFFRFGSRNMHPYRHGSNLGFQRLGNIPKSLPEIEQTPMPLLFEDARELYKTEEGEYTNRSRPSWLT